MDASSFIARRLRFKGKIAMVSIAVSFFVIIMAVSISSGFRHEIRDGISNLCGDVQLMPSDMDYTGADSPISSTPSYRGALDSLPGVKSVNPVIYRAGIVRKDDNIHGVVFKGMETSDTVSLGVRIPSRLAEILSLGTGDDMLAYFVGDKVKVRRFHITGVYEAMLDGNDNLIVFAAAEDLRRVNDWAEGEVSCLEVSLDANLRSTSGMDGMASTIGDMVYLSEMDEEPSVLVTSAARKYSRIFGWLDLIDYNVMWILILMIVVAGFNMISGLLILLFKNISTIGTLKSLGMTDRSISKVFLRVASSLILKGMAIGNVLALLFILIQGKTHLVKLNPENYFLSYVPVHLDLFWVISCDVIAYMAIMLLLLIPCLFVSRVDPAQTVRAQ